MGMSADPSAPPTETDREWFRCLFHENYRPLPAHARRRVDTGTADDVNGLRQPGRGPRRRLMAPVSRTERSQRWKPLAATGAVMAMSGGPAISDMRAGMAACIASLLACCWAASMLDMRAKNQ